MRKISPQLIRYVLTGGLSYCLELVLLIVLHYVMGLSTVTSTAIAFWFGLAASFILQKLLAFKDYQKELKVISKQVVGFGVLVAFNYAFTLFVVALFPSKLLIVSRTLALIITTIWNYFIYKNIFSKNDKISGNLKGSIDWLRKNKRRLGFGLLLTLPLLAFFIQYLATGNHLINGDFDYYAQAYEAFRISLLHYHQFPMWNPWISGGVPLFANPQIGLFSLQMLTTLAFGSIYGLKIAYVIYAIFGFWGMYLLCRKIFEATWVRSALVSYIWVFSGFFASHNISHFTTTGFFLLPWMIYLLIVQKRYSWFWFGILFSVLILSSIDFVLLMVGFVVGSVFLLSLAVEIYKKHVAWIDIIRRYLLFGLNAALIVAVITGYRFIVAYLYVSNNPRPAALLHETLPGLGVLFKGLFLPVSTLMAIPTHLQWGWGEYSMYMGMGVTVAFSLCVILAIVYFIRHRTTGIKPVYVWLLFIIGGVGFLLAIGNFAPYSPYHLLKLLPGYSQTRVSSRWLFLAAFAILIFMAAWKKTKVLINLLLLASAVELFWIYGPPTVTGRGEIKLPTSHFSNNFSEFDNGRRHLDAANNIMHSYYYATSLNKGQVYADEPFVDTLDGVVNTTRCGINIEPSCTLVLSHNAKVAYWSPNKIVLNRTGTGDIILNMNISSGWRINNVYPYANIKPIDSTNPFILPAGSRTYTVEYAPKLSPSWLKWRLSKF